MNLFSAKYDDLIVSFGFVLSFLVVNNRVAVEVYNQ